MKAPHRETLEQWFERRNQFLRLSRDETRDPPRFICRKHKAVEELSYALMLVNVHDARFAECAGGDDNIALYVPICRACNEHDQPGCIHIGHAGDADTHKLYNFCDKHRYQPLSGCLRCAYDELSNAIVELEKAIAPPAYIARCEKDFGPGAFVSGLDITHGAVDIVTQAIAVLRKVQKQ